MSRADGVLGVLEPSDPGIPAAMGCEGASAATDPMVHPANLDALADRAMAEDDRG